VAGVPTTGIAAVTANITVTTTGSTSAGQFVSVWQSGGWPGTSNLSYATGQTLAELVIVQANPDGTFQIRNGANAAVDLIVDVQGYTTLTENPAGDIYIGGTPTRLYDTRTSSGFAGAGTGPVSGTRTIQISGGASPIPDGSPAATVNLTVTSTTGTGTVTVWGAGAQPGTTNISFTAGQTVSNAAIVPLDQWGRIQLNVTGGTAQVIVDAAGYFRGDVNTWTYTYDALGNRRTAAGPPAKWNDTGNRTYQWSTAAGLPTLLVENRPWAALGGTDTYYWLYGPDSTPIAQVNPDGSLYYLHRDQLGSITLATNTTGAPISARAWDPYGKQTTSAGSAAWPIPFGWAGEYRDETGLINLRSRIYDPTTGSFLQRDPIAPITRDLYRYTAGDPFNRVDPSGLQPCAVDPSPGCSNTEVDDSGTESSGQRSSYLGGSEGGDWRNRDCSGYSCGHPGGVDPGPIPQPPKCDPPPPPPPRGECPEWSMTAAQAVGLGGFVRAVWALFHGDYGEAGVTALVSALEQGASLATTEGLKRAGIAEAGPAGAIATGGATIWDALCSLPKG